MNTDYSIFRGKKIIYRKSISTNVYTYVFKMPRNNNFEDKSKNWRLSEHKISLGKGGDKSIIINSDGEISS